jgi:hypothetical protein
MYFINKSKCLRLSSLGITRGNTPIYTRKERCKRGLPNDSIGETPNAPFWNYKKEK